MTATQFELTTANPALAQDAPGRRTRNVVTQSLSRVGQIDPLARRAGDAAIAGLFLFLLIPLFVFIAMAIKLTSRGPIFYSQMRVGRDGQLFPFVKFRTMIPGADEMRAEVLGTPDDEMPDRYRSDPRITAVGRVLRRWSVDELPQLLNVLRGEMSLVGPRPILPEELPLLDARHHDRHLCRPGLTGLWQVSGRKETSWQERMDLDLAYVRQQSFATDVRIVGRTVGVVVRGDGAF